MTTRRTAITALVTGLAATVVSGTVQAASDIATTQFKVPKGVYKIRIQSVKPDGSKSSFNFDVEPGQIFLIDAVDN